MATLFTVIENLAIVVYELILKLLELFVHHDLLHSENYQIEFFVFRWILSYYVSQVP